MVATKSKFLFDADFTPGADPAERPVLPAEHALKLAEAESRGFRDGFAQAEKEGTAEAARRMAVAFEQIGDALDRMARGLATVESRLEQEAVAVAVAAGRKLAPALIAREPFEEIAALANECFHELVRSPHVVVRVADTLLETARERLDEIARTRGFEGRLVVMADPDIAVGDCRIEWADGGIERNQAAIETAIGQVVTRYLTGCSIAQSRLPEVEPT